MRLVLLLALAAVPTAAAIQIAFSACAAADDPHEGCVAYRHVLRGGSFGHDLAGAFVYDDSAGFASFWEAFDTTWPTAPPPEIDFAREWVAVLIEDPGQPTFNGVLDVVWTAPGEYAVTYYSIYGPQPDVELVSSAFDIVAIEREAGAPDRVLFVGPYTAWDPRFNP